MKKGLVILAIVVVVVVAAAFLMMPKDDDKPSSSTTTPSSNTTQNQTSTQDSTEPAAENQVVISNFIFGPETLTVKKGTTVTWTNQDTTRHDVAPDAGDSDAFQGSELLSKGQSYSFTFNEVGEYAYHCTPHPQMKAKIVVTE